MAECPVCRNAVDEAAARARMGEIEATVALEQEKVKLLTIL